MMKTQLVKMRQGVDIVLVDMHKVGATASLVAHASMLNLWLPLMQMRTTISGPLDILSRSCMTFWTHNHISIESPSPIAVIIVPITCCLVQKSQNMPAGNAK